MDSFQKDLHDGLRQIREYNAVVAAADDHVAEALEAALEMIAGLEVKHGGSVSIDAVALARWLAAERDMATAEWHASLRSEGSR